jgi:hypothetical protein
MPCSEAGSQLNSDRCFYHNAKATDTLGHFDIFHKVAVYGANVAVLC